LASYQVMYWKHIPSQVKAWEGDAQVKKMMPDRFQVAIDAYAMKDGSTDMDAYLDGWRWGPVEAMAGPPEEVLAVVVAELDRSHPRDRLMKPEPSA
jgi:cvfA/B/C family virulence factor